MQTLTQVAHQSTLPIGSTLYLKKFMARPPGCSFLGAKATTTRAIIGGKEGIEESIIIDSGLDITLISHKLLNSLPKAPKIKSGERVNLVQVTGSATLSGYVNIPIEFHTPDGSVILEVEAYLVMGMNTPFILGNDFGDQYQLSLVHKECQTFIAFGDTGCQIEVHNSVGTHLIDEDGQTFNVQTRPNYQNASENLQAQKKSKGFHNDQRTPKGIHITASEAYVIPPETVSKIVVNV